MQLLVFLSNQLRNKCKLLTKLILVLFIVTKCFDPYGSSLGYYSVTLKKKRFKIALTKRGIFKINCVNCTNEFLF